MSLTQFDYSGIRAANTALVLEVMGFTNVKVFDGSMGVYAEDESQPPLHMGTSDRRCSMISK